jgi:hypothetical protein
MGEKSSAEYNPFNEMIEQLRQERTENELPEASRWIVQTLHDLKNALNKAFNTELITLESVTVDHPVMLNWFKERCNRQNISPDMTSINSLTIYYVRLMPIGVNLIRLVFAPEQQYVIVLKKGLTYSGENGEVIQDKTTLINHLNEIILSEKSFIRIYLQKDAKKISV